MNRRSFASRTLRRHAGLALAVALSWTPGTWAKTLLRPPVATNLESGEVDAMTVLFRDSYSEYARKPLDLVQTPTAPSPPDSDETTSEEGQMDPGAETNQESPADEYIELTFVRLASRIQVQATRKAPSGETRHTVRATMNSLDDAPEILDRVALALHHNVAFERTATNKPKPVAAPAPSKQTATTEDKSEPQKVEKEKPSREVRESDFLAGFKLGFVFPYSPAQPFDGYLSAGFDARIEIRYFFFEFGVGLGLPLFTSDANRQPDRWQMGGLYSELAFNGYLTQTDISPYVGIGLAPRLWFTNRSAGTNLLPFLQAGAMFFRTSSMRFFTDVRVGYNATPLREVFDGREIRPVEFGLNLGMGF